MTPSKRITLGVMTPAVTETLAGPTADESTIPFADLPLYEDAATALATAEALAGGIAELRERLQTGHLDADERYDLSMDLFELADRLRAFATAVTMSATR